MMFILFLLAALAIAITAAAPSMVVQIRRDREEELVHRGHQYVRAIRLFYKKFGRYPNSLKDLEDTNHLRFLRRQYKDPMTDSGEWTLLHAADIKYIPTGFFGQKLTAGTSNIGSAFGSGNTTAGTAGASQNANQPGPSNQDSFGSQSAFSNLGAQQPQQNFIAGTGSSAGGGDQTPKPDANGLVNGQLPAQGSGIFGSGGSGGQTFGGGPILGVASTSKQKSIKELNGKEHYNEWQFFYDPRMEQVQAAQQAGVAGGVQGAQPGAGQNPGFNSSFPAASGNPVMQPNSPK